MIHVISYVQESICLRLIAQTSLASLSLGVYENRNLDI
jgi:hypothetical protein